MKPETRPLGRVNPRAGFNNYEYEGPNWKLYKMEELHITIMKYEVLAHAKSHSASLTIYLDSKHGELE